MGKASRKLKKRQQQEEVNERQEEVTTLEQKIMGEIEKESYAEALDTLADMAQKNTVTPKAMYAGAYAYFMLGDYDRAAAWIDNTLKFDPNHTSARILLARLCILQDRTDSGLAIFDLLTDKYLSAMTEDEKDEIESLAGFYGRNEPERVMSKYPHLASFLNLKKDDSETPDISHSVIKTESTKTVMGLKLPPVLDETDNRGEDHSPTSKDTGKSALDILRGLKAKIDAREVGMKSSGNTLSADTSNAGQTEMKASPNGELQLHVQATDSVNMSAVSNEVTSKAQEICNGKYSVAEKVRLLNSFAGGYYATGDLVSAEHFLREALKIDSMNDGLLKNIALLLADKGEKDKAIQVMSQMQTSDFLLIKAIHEA